MKKNIIGKLLAGMLAAIAVIPQVSSKEVNAAPTPTVIYSAVEGGSVQIELDKAIYPIIKQSTRTWYVNDEAFEPDGYVYKDTSVGQKAILNIRDLTMQNSLQDYSVKDTTTPRPSGTLELGQIARLYVAEKTLFDTAELSIKNVNNKAVGDKLYASELTLYINGSAFPNFQSLAFLIDGGVKSFITVPQKETTYELIETQTGRSTQVIVNGVTDEEPPVIHSLLIKNNEGEKYSLTKTAVVVAKDNIGLPDDAYYWESNTELSTKIKEKIMAGAKSADLIGLSWSSYFTYEATSNGMVTVFVRDKAGNISYKDIKITKISSSKPEIYYVSLGKSGNTVYLDVEAEDKDKQPLKYKLNDDEWQDSNRLTNVIEGTNTVYVSNEAGNTVNTTKYVYLAIYKNEVSALSPEGLFNYITETPKTWTNKNVTVSLNLPDGLKGGLATSPYSTDGVTFSAKNSHVVTMQGEQVQFSVKDTYGNIHTSALYTVTNIDQTLPSISLKEDNGVITVSAQDDSSGIAKISVSSKSISDYVIRTNSSSGVLLDAVNYKAPANGNYKFTVTDYAGNTASSSISVSSYGGVSLQNDSTRTNNGNTGRTTISANDSNNRDMNSSSSKDGSSNSSNNSKKKDSSSKDKDNEDGKDDDGNDAFETNGNFYQTQKKSDAGHSVMKEPVEGKVIEVKKDSEAGSSTVQKLKSAEIDNTNNNNLKKLIWLLPVAILGAIVVVFIVNKKK